MDWHVIDAPDWYLGEGWALTPETAGIAEEDRRGPGMAPIERLDPAPAGPATLMVGGRNLRPRRRAGPRARHGGRRGRSTSSAPRPGSFFA